MTVFELIKMLCKVPNPDFKVIIKDGEGKEHKIVNPIGIAIDQLEKEEPIVILFCEPRK